MPIAFPGDTEKLCSKCNESQPLSEYTKDSHTKDKLSSWCRSCSRKKSRTYSAANRDKLRQQNRDWYRANRDRVLEDMQLRRDTDAEYVLENRQRHVQWREQNRDKHKNNHLKDTYGISLDDYNEIFDAQFGLCKLCHQPGVLVVDHCHRTGRIRGLLHSNCNRALGMLGDSDLLIDYLAVFFATYPREEKTPETHPYGEDVENPGYRRDRQKEKS